jgi:hypothetical protein
VFSLRHNPTLYVKCKLNSVFKGLNSYTSNVSIEYKYRFFYNLKEIKPNKNSAIFSLNSPCIFIILEIHQQNAQITNKVQSAPYHKQTLHMFRLSMSHHQGFSNSAFQMLDRSANDTRKVLHCP